MRGFWICFAFLTAVLIIPSMQQVDISAKAASEIEELYEIVAQERYAVYLDERKGNCGDCGFSPQFTRTIINGNIVDPINRFPWMVSISVNGGSIKHCGGTIISGDFIMTAAHCLKKRDIISRLNKTTCALKSGRNESCFFNKDQMKILFLTNTYNMSAGREVAEIIPHPHYQPQKSTVKNDIGLIRMSKTIQCSEYANPVCLPSSFMPVEVGMIMGISGWGGTRNEAERDGKQRTTQIEVQHPKVCSYIAEFNTKYSICLSGNGRGSPCYGDSGGPAFYQLHGKFYAMGVASAHTSVMCKTDSPVIYTSVPKHISWIKKTSGVNFKNPHDECFGPDVVNPFFP